MVQSTYSKKQSASTPKLKKTHAPVITKSRPRDSIQERRSSRQLLRDSVSDLAVREKSGSMMEVDGVVSVSPRAAIRDVRQVYGTTLYRVGYPGQESTHDEWQLEETIADTDMMREFREEHGIETDPASDGAGQQRAVKHPRPSKLRALIRLQESKNDIDTVDSDDEDKPARGQQRSRRSTKIKGEKVARAKRVDKAAVKAARRQERKEQRAQVTDAHLQSVMVPSDPKDCCIQCTVRAYRNAVADDDVTALTTLLQAKTTIPHWDSEDRSFKDDNVMLLALLKGRDNIVTMLSEDDSDKRIKVPERYQTYGSHTGYLNSSTFGHSVRQVNESRGNRQGNAAFYRSPQMDDMEVDLQRVLGHTRHSTLIQAATICKDDATRSLIASSLTSKINSTRTLLRALYVCVAAGNRDLVADVFRNGAGDMSCFNHLHREIISFTGNEDLTAYRRNQITKKAANAGNLTPLACAAIHPSSKYLQELYEKLDGAERTEADEFGRTIAHFAAASTTPACLNYLISQGYNFNLGDKYRMTPLLLAARYGRHENIEPLLKYLGNEAPSTAEFADQTILPGKRRALHFAAHYGHPKVCSVLIDCGATVDVCESKEKSTPLMLAVMRGHLECVRVLVEHGHADVEYTDKYMRTALHLAAKHGHYAIAKYLLSLGVDADAPDTSENRPIHYAAAFGWLEVVQLLIEYGNCDPGAMNMWRGTACSVASMKGHISIVQYLLSWKNGSIDVNFRDETGQTMLHQCVCERAENNVEAMQILRNARILLSHNADLDRQTIDGDTALHSLVKAAHFRELRPVGWQFYNAFGYPSHKLEYGDMEGLAYQHPLAEAILAKGANVSIKNLNGETPLLAAAKAQNYGLVELLIRHGATYWQDTDQDGNNFFHYLFEAAAYPDSIETEEEVQLQRQNAYVKVISDILAAMQDNPAPESIANITVNAINAKGYSPLLHGLSQAAKLQKKRVVQVKEMIKRKLSERSQLSEEGEPIAASTCFTFYFLIQYVNTIFQMVKMDMTSHVRLPKDFLKENPKATRKDYPPETGYSALHIVSLSQNADLLHCILSQGCDVNQRLSIDGKPAGPTAMLMGYVELVDRPDTYLPENTAYYADQLKKHFDLEKPDFKLLLSTSLQQYLSFGADPCVSNDDGYNPLIRASQRMEKEMVASMCCNISNKADINKADKEKETPLSYAVTSLKYKRPTGNTIDIIQKLLEYGADLNAIDKLGDSVFMRAIHLNNAAVVSVMLRYSQRPVDHSITNKVSETALMRACELNNDEVVRVYCAVLAQSEQGPRVVNTVSESGASALYWAVSRANEWAVATLLEWNADATFVCNDGVPLLSKAISMQLHAIVQLLLEKGDINQADPEGKTPLHYAVETEKIALVKLLLQAGANVALTNKKGQTPLHLAIERTKHQINASLRIERLLLQYGADVNVKDVLGRTPLHIAFTALNAIPKMKKTEKVSAKVHQILHERVEASQEAREFKEYMKQHGLNDTRADQWLQQGKLSEQQQAKLAKASKTSEKAIVLTPQEREELEPLTWFIWNLQQHPLPRSDPVHILKFLADVDSLQYDEPDCFGRTPLHYAAAVGAFTCTTYLMSRAVNINRQDHDTNTPLYLALQNEQIDYSIMLYNAGASIAQDMMMPQGEKCSVTHYSLSKSYLNMAYMIIERGTAMLDFMFDALKTGKFHLANILMHDMDDATLSRTVAPYNQNIWHLLSGFEPFDRETWDEYVTEFIDRITPLNLTIYADTQGRTPIHYAAKFNQPTLLRHLLSLNSAMAEFFDADGLSALWYAVSSNSVECTQILLAVSGPTTFEPQDKSKHESLLLRATQNGNLNMMRLLLSAQVPMDDDSAYDRPNAVLVACQSITVDMLELLVSAGANLDTPSTVIRRDDDNKEHRVPIAPIFEACKASSKMLRTMLAHKANPNVYGPVFKPEEGRSCFMYNSYCEKIENLKIMLDHGADINMKDGQIPRSIFYHYFFDQHGEKKFSQMIYHDMILNHHPEVDKADLVTGMTPLGVAIREGDTDLVNRLLQKGADPNACGTCVSLDSNDNEQVNALFHAVILNQLAIFKLICKKSTYPLDWDVKDRKGQTIVSRLVNQVSGYSYENVAFLKDLCKAIPAAKFEELAQTPDHNGLSACQYAKERFSSSLYQALMELGVSGCVGDEEVTVREPESDTTPMEEMDAISMQAVEIDADKERKILEADARAEKEAQKAMEESKDEEKEEDRSHRVPVDPYSKLQNIGHVVYEQEEPLDIMVMKIDMSLHGYNSNMFYKLSVIYNRVLEVYVLWTRWGAFGEEGMHQKTPFLERDAAVTEFKALFKSKTGNHWDDRLTNFQPKPGRFQMIKVAPSFHLPILKPFDFAPFDIPTSIPDSIYQTMQLFCNYRALKHRYENTKMDVPIGQVPQTSIDQASAILTDIKALVDRYANLPTYTNDPKQAAERKLVGHEICQKSAAYYRLLPMESDKKYGISPLMTLQKFHEERARLNDVSYITFAANVILAAKHRLQEIHPLEYAYRALDCRMKEMTPTGPEADDYHMVSRYLMNTGRGNYEISHLFAVDRPGESERFKPFETNENRKLLWHGSEAGNFMGLLKQGLRCRPGHAHSYAGALFGKGIYFADTFSKANGYASNYTGSDNDSYRLLLLCEVALGKECEMVYHWYQSYDPAEGHMSVKALGKQVPDPEHAIYDASGMQIPLGPIVPFKPQVNSREFGSRQEQPDLYHNEYIVYDEAQVRIRYLVVTRNSNRCFLCQSNVNANNMKPLCDYTFEAFNYADLNKYEKEYAKTYLVHAHQTVKDVFDAELPDFIQSRSYSQRWTTPILATSTSKVCSKCANSVATMLLVKRLQKEADQLPDAVIRRPVCIDGFECRNKEDHHLKTYQHWQCKNRNDES